MDPHSMWLIETAKGGYIIDAGAPVMDCLLRRGFEPEKLKAVFITHMHGDHVNGLIGRRRRHLTAFLH